MEGAKGGGYREKRINTNPWVSRTWKTPHRDRESNDRSSGSPRETWKSTKPQREGKADYHGGVGEVSGRKDRC